MGKIYGTSGHDGDERGATVDAPSPGKRTLTAGLPAAAGDAVQRKADGATTVPTGPSLAALDDPFAAHLLGGPVQRAGDGAAVGDEHVHAAARLGTSGSGGALPHAEAIQRSFGAHDISGIRAHTDGAAAAGTSAMGAQAFATGNDVAFAPGAADLHTAAHEAAHVVQQRAGVHLAGGVGAEGDAFERHADAVADRVVAGQSAEDLLSATPAGGAAVAAKAIQRSSKATSMGTFTDEKYALEGTAKLHMTLKFTPGDKVDATKIGLTQSLKDMKDGDKNAIDPTARSRKSDDGHAIDRLSDNNNPIYGAGALGDGKGLGDSKDTNNNSGNANNLNPDDGKVNATYQLGHRTKVGDTVDTKDAGLYDAPTIVGGNNSSKEFETTAVALDGPQKDTYFGSVKWGWKKDGSGTVSKVDFDIVSMGVPSKEFLGAADKWNEGTVRGTMVPKADATPVYNGAGVEQYTIDAATEMKMKGPVAIKNVYHLFVEILSDGDHKGETVYVKTDTVKDKGDGKPLVKLPMVEVYCTTGATKVYKAADKSEEVKTVPVKTRVKVLATSGDTKQIEIVDGGDTGLKGFVDAVGLTKE